MQQGTGQAVEALVQVLVVGTGHGNNVALLLDDHIVMEGLGQRTLGALDGNDIAISDGNLDACRYGNRHLANSRHSAYLLTR